MFADPEGIFFRQTSTADVFDIRDGKGTLCSSLHDDELTASLKVSSFAPGRNKCLRTLSILLHIFVDGC